MSSLLCTSVTPFLDKYSMAIATQIRPRYIGVRSGIGQIDMALFDLPLPEITVEDFERSWARFH